MREHLNMIYKGVCQYIMIASKNLRIFVCLRQTDNLNGP